jgi:hypothetical protein
VTQLASRTTRARPNETVRLARQAAAAAGPTEALRTIALLRKHLETLEAEQVDAALKTGYSWRLIAEALGVSRQAAHRRHAARVAAAARAAEEQSLAGSRLVIVGPVRAAVVMAREEAAAVQSRLVGTEHLLTGLVRERKGAAAEALTTLGVTLDKVRHCAQASADRAHGDPETEDHSPPGWAAPARLPFSRRGRQALEQALREAVRLDDEHLGVEHLLLALLRDPDSRAVQCLEHLKVTPAMVEDELRALRRDAPGRPA